MPLDCASDPSTSKDTSSHPQATNFISLPELRRTTTCEVCEKTPSKYCCPQCSIRYCSVACFKLHRESPDAKSSCESRRPVPAKKPRLSECDPIAQTTAASSAPPPPPPTDEELYARPIAPERLARLLESDELQRLLRDSPELVASLRALAGAPFAPQRTNRPNRKRGRRAQSDWVPPPDEFTRQLDAAFRDTKFASFAQMCIRIVSARK